MRYRWRPALHPRSNLRAKRRNVWNLPKILDSGAELRSSVSRRMRRQRVLSTRECRRWDVHRAASSRPALRTSPRPAVSALRALRERHLSEPPTPRGQLRDRQHVLLGELRRERVQEQGRLLALSSYDLRRTWPVARPPRVLRSSCGTRARAQLHRRAAQSSRVRRPGNARWRARTPRG